MDQPPPPPRTAYSVREIAASLGVSKETVYRLCASGEIPSERFGGRVVVPVAWLNARMAS
jgi:excisionase family DNA binding protein